MFDSVLGRGNVPGGRFGVGTVVSVVVHVGLLGFAIWFSTIPPEKEEKEPEVTFFAAPPPPPPPPPPPASSTPKTEKKVEKKKKPVKKPDTIVQAKDPTPVPEEPQQAEEPEEEEPVEGGVEGGVVGGVAGGVVGGVIGGTIGGQIGGQLGGEVMSFGEGMARPKQVKGRAPQYTREAIEARVEGTMLVQCVITTDGDLKDCKIIKPLPHMEQAVLDALRTWKYTPVTYQGRPVPVKYIIPIRLVIPNR